MRVLTMTMAVLLSASFTGCVVAPYRSHAGGYGGYDDGYGGDVVAIAPPPPRVETVPVAPFLGALWIAGYWGYQAGRHSWVPGRWERPRAGYRWAPRQWHQHGHGWRQRGGGWVRH